MMIPALPARAGTVSAESWLLEMVGPVAAVSTPQLAYSPRPWVCISLLEMLQTAGPAGRGSRVEARPGACDQVAGEVRVDMPNGGNA